MQNQTEDTGVRSLVHERQAWRSRFLARSTRLRNQLSKRWWILAAGVALGLAVQMILRRFETPLYISSGRMIVNLKLSIPEGSLYTEELNNFLGTQAALMQSAVVTERAQQRMPDTLGIGESGAVTLKALILPRTTIFVLQGTGPEARYTQAFVQACMEEYINLKKEMRVQTSDSTLAGMTEEVVRLEKELRRCDEELVAFCSSNSVVLLQEQGNSAASFLAGLNQRLAALKSEFSLLQVLDLDQNLERSQPSTGGCEMPSDPTVSPVRFETAGLADGDYLRARQQVLLLKAEQDDLAQYLRPKHPKIVALTEEIGHRERLLQIFRQQSAQQFERRRESLRLQILNIEAQVKEWDARALEMSRRDAEFKRLKANAQRTQALYDRLLAAMQTLDLNKQISPESVTIMEKASPGMASRAALTRRVLVGALTGLAGGLLLLMLLDRLDDRVGSPSELADLFDEEVLAHIPCEKSALRKGAPGLLCPQDERYAFVEAYRSLRSSLLYLSGTGERPKTLLVTSSVPNEGKSLTSSNLAITLADAGSRVLLVDADLRKGSLHHRFGISSGVPGLFEAIGCEPGSPVPTNGLALNPKPIFEWESFVQTTRVPNLFLLPRGGTTHRSSELFLGQAAIDFLGQAGVRYDFVVLDMAPVMAADDVTSLAPHVDGVLFVIRSEQTSARVARAALDLLYQRHVRVLGLVLNAFRPSSADYYHYYRYKDYHASYPAA